MPVVDEKISEMPVASSFLNADLIPMIHAGDNYAVARGVLLFAQPGDPISLQNGFAQIAIYATSEVNISTSHNITIEALAGPILVYAVSGALQLQGGTSTTMLNSLAAPIVIQQITGSSLTIHSVGIEADVAGGQTFILKSNSSTVFAVNAAGRVAFTPVAGQAVIMLANGGEFIIDSGGNVSIVAGSGVSPVIEYDELNSSLWASVPTDLAQAIEQIAAAVAGILGHPIP